MRTIVFLAVAMILVGVLTQDVSAYGPCSTGGPPIFGFSVHGQFSFLNWQSGAPSPLLFLADSDFGAQRGERKDEEPKKEDKKERKEDEKERGENDRGRDRDDDDDDFAGACIGSIIEGLFCSGDDDDEMTPASVYPTSTFLYSAIVISEPGSGVTRTLWSDLGGERSGANPLWTVVRNSVLEVRKERLYEDETWLEVTVVESPYMMGWIKKEYVEEYAPVRETRYVDLPRWQLLFSICGGLYFNGDLFDEYGGRIWCLNGGARIFPTDLFQIMIRGSYLKAYGDPGHVWYKTSDAKEFPEDSRLSISRLSFMAGTYHFVGNTPTQVAWAVGPCLSRIAEKAEIVVEGEGYTDFRVDELDQYRVGVDMSLDFQWRVGESVPVFVDIGAYIIPVKRDGEKSLTVDFLDSSVIGGMTIGFGLGYSIF